MPKIRVNQFHGKQPKIAPHLLALGRAQEAVDCDVRSQSLKPLLDNKSAATPVSTNFVDTIYRYEVGGDVYWLEWESDVDVVRGPVAGDTTQRMYITDGVAPRVFDTSLFDQGGGGPYPEDSYLLAVPGPAIKCDASLGGGGSGSARSINYVYTYVREWASGKFDESAPSPASDTFSALPGQTVNLSNLYDPPAADDGITHKYIYRLVTGSGGAAEYQYVDKVAVGTTSYSDSKLDAALEDVLPSEDWETPPNDMRGLLVLPNGCGVGFSGNELLVSVPYQLHAYPGRYRFTVDSNIVGIGAVGNTVIVGTEAYPYIFTGSDPDAMRPNKIQKKLPCLSKRGVVSTGQGVLWPTYDGMALVSPYGSWQVITRNLLTSKEWKALRPSSMYAIEHEGRIHVSWHQPYLLNGDRTGGGFILDVSESGAELIDTGFYTYAGFSDPASGTLYLSLRNNNVNSISIFEGHESYRSYTWRSREFIAAYPMLFTAARVIGDFSRILTQDEQDAIEAERLAAIATNEALIASGEPLGGDLNGAALHVHDINGDILENVAAVYEPPAGITFRLFLDGAEAANVSVLNSKPFRLPRPTPGARIEFALAGKIDVREVRLGTSVSEIAE